MKRDTQPLYRLDYTYWSSPVKSSSGFTLEDLSPNTLASKYYIWNDVWASVPKTTVMANGKGYIVRAPQSFDIQGQVGATPEIYNSEFEGVPNNGVITVAVSNTGLWNLIGNPYPSAIDISAFYDNLNNQSHLEGTIYLWTHNTPIGLEGTNYNYSPSDYASYNMSGGVGTTAESGGNEPTGYVAAGQAFFVQSVSQGTITFNNSMRVKEGGVNNQFFKSTPVESVENWETTGKHRVWLNLTSTQNDFNQILVGYIENATNNLDWGYDGTVFSGGVVSLYSILDTKKLTIQGRALPFSNLDEVPLGYKTTLTGTLTISIDHLDGLLEGQNIYLKDNLLNVVHNLKESDYTFTTIPGTFNERFVLRYLPEEDLNTNNPIIDENSILIFNDNNQISIRSSEHIIKKVEIYDLQGRLLWSKNKVNEKMLRSQNLTINNQIILVKITTDTNAELFKKVLMN